MPEPSINLSDWYEITKGDDLRQGDIVKDCPVFLPPKEITWPLAEDQVFECGTQDVIIMSQSCDLEANQKSDMWQVLLCPLWSLSDAAAANAILASSYGKEECRRGHMTGYHMISECTHELWNQDISIVSFREVYSLPLNFLRNMTSNTGNRLRLRSPYREHLGQAFARYFMRVGLPVDIPPFQSPKTETEVMKKLEKMDSEARKRIFSYFS